MFSFNFVRKSLETFVGVLKTHHKSSIARLKDLGVKKRQSYRIYLLYRCSTDRTLGDRMINFVLTDINIIN